MGCQFKGKPEYYKDDCTGCGVCKEVCPSRAIEFTDDLKARTRRFTLRLDACLFCGNCQANCVTGKGIMLTSQCDMSVYDRDEAVVSVEKELLLCESCGAVIGAKDHLRHLAKRLGPLGYANPGLILANQDGLGFGSGLASGPDSKAPQARAVIFKVLCPVCRRSAMLKDEKDEARP